MAEPSTETVTFLFTDIEGSTRLWEQHPEAMKSALARHDALLTTGIQQLGGRVVKSRGEGDSLFAVFAHASDALAAACSLQQALLAETWPTETPLRVRMALHTDIAEHREGDYYGPGVIRCARLRAVAHGGQVLLSHATSERVQDALPEGASLRDLGSHRLKDLRQPEHLFQLLHPALPAEFPPPRSLEALAHNLPVQLTSFIGRAREMAEVKGLLTTSHLLTLTGSGGCGKTRLALQVAAGLLEEYADGAWLVELAPLADPALVPQAVATALGVQEEPGRPLTQTLTDYLRTRSLLLLLDNCEHLLTASAQLADALLRTCPNLRILASSREGLGIAGERTYRVPSLSLPDPKNLPPLDRLTEYEAVHLFVERAAFSQPSFSLTDQNARATAEVCQRLDGIPLALELAAARVRALSVEQIATRLDDRFRLLTGGSRTALPRQQTLRALIDWSYDLLFEPERALLRRLSVFVDGWSMEAAEAVCAGDAIEEWEVLDLLTGLVDKSLVVVEERGTEVRYRLLETVRQYSRDRMLESGEAEALRERHLAFFLRLAEAAPELEGTKQVEGLDYLDRDHDNFRAALSWATERGDGESGLRLAAVIGDFWAVQGYLTEAREAVVRLLPLLEGAGQRAERIRALRSAGASAWMKGDFTAASQLFEERLTIQQELGDKAGAAECYGQLAVLSRFRGDYARARSLYEQGMALYQELDDQRGAAVACYGLGYVSYLQGDLAPAQVVLEESLVTLRELGDRKNSGWVLLHLGEVADARADYPRAIAYLEESLAIWHAMDHRTGITVVLNQLGRVAKHQGDWQTARSRFAECLRTIYKHEVTPELLLGLAGLAEVAGAQGEPERAARLFGAVEALGEAGRCSFGAHEGVDHERGAAAAREVLGEEAFAAAWAAGRATPLDEALAYALEPEPQQPSAARTS